MDDSMNQEKCANCTKLPEDILMLECSHDLCLECASKIYAYQKNKLQIKCLICSEITILD